MKITPINNTAFIIEEVEDSLAGRSALQSIGFQNTKERNLGVVGTIYSVCENSLGIKEGSRVLFSKFVAEQIDLKDENGNLVKNLRSVPIDMISAILS